MFFRTVVIKKGNKSYKYLRLIENYRQDGKVKQRVIANLGNLDNIPPDRIDSLISSLYRYTTKKEFDLSSISTNYAKNYGDILAIKKIWDELKI